MSLYEEVTNRIIAELESGTVPWVKPWKTMMPYNAISQKEYSGVNVLLLWHTAFAQSAWLTYRQAKELGGHVKQGEKATSIVYASKYTKKAVDESGEETEEEIPFLKWYHVFNIDQCERLPERLYQRPVPITDTTYKQVESFITHIGASVKHGGTVACFVPSLDLVRLPNRTDFESIEHYYATSLHEHGHWTGHKSRLNRDLSHRFGESSYAAEELIAEMTAAFLCAHLGIPGKLRHAEYITSWLRVLKEDKKAIFTAARKATEAADHLRFVSELASGQEEAVTEGRMGGRA
ncbi:MAG: zincin-like metallopeptidase domain-containing protein [Nitrososphaera sp.]|nr:zincin-like metallopeptidase domain-containing protein [Nitrososphaera sp.]